MTLLSGVLLFFSASARGALSFSDIQTAPVFREYGIGDEEPAVLRIRGFLLGKCVSVCGKTAVTADDYFFRHGIGIAAVCGNFFPFSFLFRRTVLRYRAEKIFAGIRLYIDVLPRLKPRDS